MNGNIEALRNSAVKAAKEGHPRRISIRELLSHWGEQSRTDAILKRIDGDLADVGLRCVPSCQLGHIDDEVSLELAGLSVSNYAEEGRDFRDLLVRNLACATQPDMASVAPTDDLNKAITLMLTRGLQQIPVLNGRELKGSIDWRTVALSLQRGKGLLARDAMVDRSVPTVHLDDRLFDLSNLLGDYGYLWVEHHGAVVGCLTQADLAKELLLLSKPFLLLGVAERNLRYICEHPRVADLCQEIWTERL